MTQTLSAADFLRLSLPRRRNKYNISPKPDRTWRGKLYASKAEMGYAQLLDKDPQVVEVVEQPRLRLGEDHVYVPDFLVITRYGHHFYIDVKGVETAGFRKSKKLWLKYGRLDLVIVVKRGDTYKTKEIIVGGAKRAAA